jgi:hypothetical protein
MSTLRQDVLHFINENAPVSTMLRLQEQIDAHPWRFAKSMPQWPHWYTLRKQWDDAEFTEVVTTMRAGGFTEYWHGRKFRAFNLNGYKYWTMGAPADVETVLNRKPIDYPAQYDAIADEYATLFNDAASKAEDAEIAEQLAGYTAGRVLDIGCGAGLLVDLADIPYLHYTGIDPSTKMLAHFKAAHPLYEKGMVNTTFEEYATPLKFDSIVCLYGSLNHVQPDALPRIETMLAPGGTYFLMLFGKGYTPVTYGLTGHTLQHYDTDLSLLPPDAIVEPWRNYLIVRSP